MEKQQIFELIGLLSGYSTLPFQYTIEYYFYKKFLGFKNKAWQFALCALFLTIIDFFIMKTSSFALRILINDIIWFFIIYFLCTENFVIKLYASILPNAILLLTSITFFVFDFFIAPIMYNTNNISFNKRMSISFINNISSDIIRLTILFIFLKSICNMLNLKEKAINLYYSLYLLVPCLSSYGLAVIFFIVQEININNKKYFLPYIFPKLYYVLPFVSIALLLSLLITAYTFKKMLEGHEHQQRNLLMEQQFQLQLTHSKNINALYGGIRSVIHDMNNHLACLRSLADDNNMEEIQKYLHNISETVNKLDFKIKTGNPISDAVINEKYNIAKAEGIEFICDFMLPKETLLESVDLCIILSNALDNAIEACMRVTNDNIPKVICVKSYIRDMYLIIEVSNTNIHKLIYVNDKVVSTKHDRINHGIGICNMEAVVKKYNGIIDIIEEKNKFTISIMVRNN